MPPSSSTVASDSSISSSARAAPQSSIRLSGASALVTQAPPVSRSFTQIQPLTRRRRKSPPAPSSGICASSPVSPSRVWQLRTNVGGSVMAKTQPSWRIGAVVGDGRGNECVDPSRPMTKTSSVASTATMERLGVGWANV